MDSEVKNRLCRQCRVVNLAVRRGAGRQPLFVHLEGIHTMPMIMQGKVSREIVQHAQGDEKSGVRLAG